MFVSGHLYRINFPRLTEWYFNRIMIVVPRAMKLKFLAACSLLSGWCVATGLLSVKVQVENGPARLVGHQYVSNVLLTTTFFGRRVVKVGMHSRPVSSELQSGQAIEPALAKLIETTMPLLSLGFLVVSFFFARASSPFASETCQTEGRSGVGGQIAEPATCDLEVGCAPPPTVFPTATFQTEGRIGVGGQIAEPVACDLEVGLGSPPTVFFPETCQTEGRIGIGGQIAEPVETNGHFGVGGFMAGPVAPDLEVGQHINFVDSLEAQTVQNGAGPTADETAEDRALSECWGESESEEDEEEEEEPPVSNAARDALVLQAATMGLQIKRCEAPEVHAEVARVALARLDKKSGEQGDELDESDAASLLDTNLVMVGAVKIIGGLMMSKICGCKGLWEVAV